MNRAITEAEPILTRVSIGRSDDGQRFGMFIQIYADGTVLDTDGVRKVGPEVLRPLIEALRAAELGKTRPHCGGPPIDFVEQVHLTVYDQNRGRRIANHLTYSGNTQGCDPRLQGLHAAIDNVQVGLAGVGPKAVSTGIASPPIAPQPVAGQGDSAPPLPPLDSPAIGLTPYN